MPEKQELAAMLNVDGEGGRQSAWRRKSAQQKKEELALFVVMSQGQ
jgi:hypothetical protein